MIILYGCSFELDNADWQAPKDAALLYEKWESNMRRLSEKTITQAHADYLAAVAAGDEAMEALCDNKQSSSPAWMKVQNCANRAAASIFKTYRKDFLNVMSGHNYFVSAIEP